MCVCVCAMSTISHVGSRSSNGMRMCVCVCGRNELEVCITLAYPHISSFRTMPVLYTSTHILKPFEDRELTGLTVDIAKRMDVVYLPSECAVS